MGEWNFLNKRWRTGDRRERVSGVCCCVEELQGYVVTAVGTGALSEDSHRQSSE